MSKLLILCHRIKKFAENGIPVKDAIEPSDYTEAELIYVLACNYIASNMGPAVSKERAEL